MRLQSDRQQWLNKMELLSAENQRDEEGICVHRETVEKNELLSRQHSQAEQPAANLPRWTSSSGCCASSCRPRKRPSCRARSYSTRIVGELCSMRNRPPATGKVAERDRPAAGCLAAGSGQRPAVSRPMPAATGAAAGPGARSGGGCAQLPAARRGTGRGTARPPSSAVRTGIRRDELRRLYCSRQARQQELQHRRPNLPCNWIFSGAAFWRITGWSWTRSLAMRSWKSWSANSSSGAWRQ